MTSLDLAYALALSVPMVGALACAAITALDLRRTSHPVRRRIHMQALAAYALFAMCWALLVSREVAPHVHVITVPILMPGTMLSYIMLFRMIRTATDQGDGKPFPKTHFVAPLSMFVATFTLWLAIPADKIATVVLTASSPAALIMIGICFVFGIIYSTAALVRIVRFRRRRGGNTPHDRVLVRLFWAILLGMITAPVPVWGMALGIAPFTNLGWVWLVVVLPSRIIYTMSCFDLLSDNYMIVEAEQGKPVPAATAPNIQRLGRERVEQYIDTKKPWLNPAFRIGDMAEDLFSNRAYISAFINSEYGMNFNRFVNGFRLAEVERLREEADRKKQRVSMLQLILNAGFSSYRSYLRAKAASMERDDCMDGGNPDELTPGLL